MGIGQINLDEYFRPGHVRNVYSSISVYAHNLCDIADTRAEKEGIKVSFQVSRKDLFRSIISAYYDIARYKQFHFGGDPTKRSDGVKRAAYCAKWILKFRPIQARFADAHDDPEATAVWPQLLNEQLAVNWSAMCVALDHKTMKFKVRHQLYNELMYAMHFREIGVDGMLQIFQMLSDTFRDGSVNNPFIEFPQ